MSATAAGTRPRVVLDLVPFHPGRGGTGGGIWSYARHLVRELDALDPPDVEIVCLAHRDLAVPARRLRVERVDADTRSPARRLAWIHGRLPAWCARHRVDVLHKLATEIPATLPGVRVVATVHDFMEVFYAEAYRGAADGLRPGLREPPAARYFALATRRCFARSDAIVTVTETVAAEARRRFPRAAGRVTAVLSGVEPAAPSPARARGAADDRPLRLLCVGMLRRHKNQLGVVRAFERLHALAPALAARTTLTVRGFEADADYAAAVRRAADASGAGARIAFAGYEPDADAARLYGDADLLLLLSDYEGFGLPLLEAQAAGVPVLCSDIPVFREVLGDSACFVPPGDADAAAAALAALLADPARRDALARRGRENAARFSWTRTAREMLDVYRRAAAARRAVA